MSSIYILFWFVCTFVLFCRARNNHFERTGNFVKLFWDGPDGSCEEPTDKGYAEDGCAVGWIKNSSTKLPHETSENKSGCKYFQRTALWRCPKSTADDPAVRCWKSVSSYMIRPACAGVWLNWGSCDAFCGQGKKTRVRFAAVGDSSFSETYENRPCQIRACGTWTNWSSETKCNNGKCSKTVRRWCVYNESLADISFCSGKHADVNVTAVTIQLPCQTDACRTTPAITSTTFPPTTQTISSQSTLSLSTRPTVDTGYSTDKSTDANIEPSTAGDGNGTSTQFIDDTSLLLNRANTTFEAKSDLWIGLIVGLLIASILYAVISLVLRRRKVKRRKGDWSGAYYDTHLAKCDVIEGSDKSGGGKDPLLRDETMRSLVERSSTFENGNSAGNYSNQLCVDVTDPLYAHIPALTEAATESPTAGGNVKFQQSAAARLVSVESEDNENRPDMFDDESDVFDSEEERDVLRTLKRPSPKSKRKTLSLKRINAALLNAWVTSDARQSNGSSDVDSSAPKLNSQSFSACHQRPNASRIRRKSNSDSISSLNLSTSGYNSSVFDESTDDENAAVVSTRRRESSIRKSARLLRRKLSRARGDKGFANLKMRENSHTIPYGLDNSDNLLHAPLSAESTEPTPPCQPKQFSTLKPVRRQGPSVLLSRNDRLIVIEDEYSLPIDAVKLARPVSPYNGYKVPFDAICKTTDPT